MNKLADILQIPDILEAEPPADTPTEAARYQPPTAAAINDGHHASRCVRCRATISDPPPLVAEFAGVLSVTQPLCPVCDIAPEPLESAFTRCCGIPKGFLAYDTDKLPESAASRILAASLTTGVYIQGQWGTGKSRAAAFAAMMRRPTGHGLRWINCAEWGVAFLAEFSDGFDAVHRALDSVAKAGLLVLDDLGAGVPSPRITEALFVILDRRYREGMETWVTTNYDHEALADRLGEAHGAKIVRRLADMTAAVRMDRRGSDNQKGGRA